MHIGKLYKALRREGLKIPMRIVRKVTEIREVCTKFRGELSRDVHHFFLYSETPNEMVYTDVIGPLPPVSGELSISTPLSIVRLIWQKLPNFGIASQDK